VQILNAILSQNLRVDKNKNIFSMLMLAEADASK